MKKGIIAALLCGLAVLFVACAAKKRAAKQTDITLLEWRLLSVKPAGGEDMIYPVKDSGQQATLNISPEGQAHGNAGCNGFSGKATLLKQQIQFEGIRTTRMLCEEGMDIENAFIGALQAADSYEISGNILRLKYKNSVLATFTSYK